MARTGRPRGFSRELGVAAAMQAFWQHGYEGASIDTLRSVMGGISSASFYAAFGSKEELYREALDLYQATHGTVVTPLYETEMSPRDRIERTLRASARMQTDDSHPRGCMVTLSATIGPPQHQGLRDAAAAIRYANREAIDRAVSEAVAEGALRRDAAVGLPVMLDMALNGLALVARDGADAGKLERAVDAAMACWDSFALT